MVAGCRFSVLVQRQSRIFSSPAFQVCPPGSQCRKGFVLSQPGLSRPGNSYHVKMFRITTNTMMMRARRMGRSYQGRWASATGRGVSE